MTWSRNSIIAHCRSGRPFCIWGGNQSIFNKPLSLNFLLKRLAGISCPRCKGMPIFTRRITLNSLRWAVCRMRPLKAQLHPAPNSRNEKGVYSRLCWPIYIPGNRTLWVQFYPRTGRWWAQRGIRDLGMKLSFPLCPSSELKYVLGELLGIVP